MTQCIAAFWSSTILPITRNMVAIAGLTLLAACGGGGDITPPPPGQTAIQVENSSSRTVVDIRFSSCSASTYGSDRYDGALGPDESTTFETSPGCYDIRTETTDGVVDEFVDETVSSGQTTTVTVTN